MFAPAPKPLALVGAVALAARLPVGRAGEVEEIADS
jgi:hypothetical protein